MRLRRHQGLLCGGLFFGFFVVASAVGSPDLPLLSDSQHYFFIAERAAAGVPPHVSQFDPKNGLSMLISAGAMRAGRLAGIDDVTASRILSVLAGALATGLVWPVTRRLTGSALAAWVASTSMLALNRFAFLAAMGSQPKTLLVLFLLLSFLWLSRSRCTLAGAAAGAAFLCWQPAAMLVVAGPVALVAGGARKRAALEFLAAAMLLIAAYEAYYVYHGALAVQLEQAFLFPMHYMEELPKTLRPVLRRGRWVLSIADGVRPESVVPLLFVAWLAVVWSGWWRRGSKVARAARGRPDRIYLALAAHGALANCLVSYQGFPDRFLLDPMMGIAAGWMVAGGIAMCERRWRFRGAESAATVACAALVAVLAVRGHWNFRELRGLSAQRHLAETIGRFLDAGYTVYAVGCTHLLAFNHANNHTPFGFFFRGVAEYLQVKTSGRSYRPLKDGRLPDIILLSRAKYLPDQPWFQRNYVRAKRDDFGEQMVQVWLRLRSRSQTQSR